MKITIKDLKKKNAVQPIIDYFKKSDNALKKVFGKKLDKLVLYNELIAFYCIHWFICNFKYDKIKKLKLHYYGKWIEYIYTFDDTFFEKYCHSSKGDWYLKDFDKNETLRYYVNSQGEIKK